MPRKDWSIVVISILAIAGASFPASAADVSVAVEPLRADFLERSFLDDRPRGIELSGTWSIGDSLDMRVAWRDAQTPLTPVVSSPFWREYSASGYSLSLRGRALGPFELHGRVDVLDQDVATTGLKLDLQESRRITIAGASARWRPSSEANWGLEAGANRASHRPTFVGIGVFFTF